MNRSLLLSLLALCFFLVLPACDVGNDDHDDDDSGEVTPAEGSFANTCSVTDRFTAVDLGPVITTEFMGMDPGVVVADHTGYRTEDGDLRLYFWAGGQGQAETGAYSVLTPDGTEPQLEEGLRIPSPYGHPKLTRATDGTFHMFHLVPNGLGSHTSPDGTTFTLLPGYRILSADTEIERVGGMSVVDLEGGGYRGYFSSLGLPGVPPEEAVDRLQSASSEDLVTWTVDGGIRIGDEAPHLTGKRRQPFALKRSGSCVTLFVQQIETVPTKLFTTTAEDGLTFTEEFEIGIEGWDFAEAGAGVLQLADGSYRLFYDAQSDELGNHIRVAELSLAE